MSPRVKTFLKILIGVLSLALLALFIQKGYGKSWTGFQSYIAKGEVVPAKKLWDWMALLLVPVGLALAAFYFNKRQKESELRKTTSQQQEASLQAFITQMGELLLTNNLRQSKPEQEVRTIARARTLTVLKELDGKRKGLMIRFLLESRLIQKDEETIEKRIATPVISLAGADLGGADLTQMDLSEVVFSGADLTGANLEFSNLKKSEKDLYTRFDPKWDLVWQLVNWYPPKDGLRGRDLRNSDLTGVNLMNFELNGTDLRGAILDQANLFGAKIDKDTKFDAKWSQIWKIVNLSSERTNMQRLDLSRADLSGLTFNDLDLSGCNLDGANLQSGSFRGAILRGISGFDPNFDEADLSNADLTNARLPLASFHAAKLPGAKLGKADLEWAKLNDADLQHTDLRETDFRLADLSGADLTGANLTGARFKDTEFDDETQWPTGFDPKMPGLKRLVSQVSSSSDKSKKPPQTSIEFPDPDRLE